MNVRLISAAIVIAFALAALAASEHAKPNDALPLVSADFPVCVTIRPPPLQQQPSGVNPYPRRKDFA